MFEKEAEEYGNKNCGTRSLPIHEAYARGLEEGFQDGAELGYNKAKEEVEEKYKETLCNSELNLASVTEQLEELEKANEWHYVEDGDLPTDTTVLYLVRVYSWNFGLSHLYKKYGMYIPTVCEWGGEYFKALNDMAYSNARNIKSCIAWKEIVLPKESE